MKNSAAIEYRRLGYSNERRAINPAALDALKTEFTCNSIGERSFEFVRALANSEIADVINKTIRHLTGKDASPTRIIFFDKTTSANWSLGWHQDRVIAVRERKAIAGYNKWTVKGGTIHVEPPFEVMENSITVRISVDPADHNNGALEILPGSHRLGKLSDSRSAALGEISEAKTLETNPGDIVFLSTPILHRSGPSRTSRRRRTIQIDYSWAPLPKPLEWAFR
ncbi:MAG: phytanoyl-CoA dioxygenase family protein [Pseudomonadota bacterium]